MAQNKPNTSSKYGEDHRRARQERMDMLGDNPKCEITQQELNLSAHHQVPKLFSGPDMKENYIILSRAFHDYLHAVCNVRDGEMVGKRLYLADYIKKHILDDVKRETAIQELDKIDEVLMSEYINNLINVLAKDFHDIIFQTIYSNFQTIKHQAIHIHHLEAKYAALSVPYKKRNV